MGCGATSPGTVDTDPVTVMAQFVQNAAKAYEAAKEQNLLVILCIPNFYDSMGMEQSLEKLVRSGCDAVAVMNYDKTDEAGQIFEEAAIAEKNERYHPYYGNVKAGHP